MTEINNCNQSIKKFTLKYGMDYREFCDLFFQLPQPLFEKEEDSAEWNSELFHLKLLHTKLH